MTDAHEPRGDQPRDRRLDHDGNWAPASRSEARGRRADEVRHALGLTALSTLVPGLGLVFTRRRRFGLALLAASVIAALALGFLVLNGGVVNGLSRFLTRRGLLILLGVFAVGGLLWVFGIMLTARETSRRGWGATARWSQRIFTALMCLMVAVPAARATQYVIITQGAFHQMFQDRYQGRGTTVRGPVGGSDPWAKVPRVNLMLVGSDAGPDRTGVRTDSLMVASIDTKTGDTTLISIPRNLENVPFPANNPLHKIYPKGFNCGSQCLMDAVWQQAASDHRDLFPKDEANPGLDTTREVVQEITGLQIDYSTVIDLSGFQQLVDAMGGVKINVPEPGIPIGGSIVNGREVPGSITGWVQPGYRKLNGYDALWYSRSRVRDPRGDFGRMQRQRCMVNALISQTNPVAMLQKFPQIMDVARNNISFDMNQDNLPAFANLVERMKEGNMRSVNLSPPTIISAHPDYDKIRSLVKEAIAKPHDESAPTSSGTPTTASGTSTPSVPSSTSTGTPTPTDAITDTASSC